jgi:hypothetical protein
MTKEIILSGSEESLKPIISMMIALTQLLEEKDIGQFLGESIVFFSVKTPPWKSPTPGKKLVKATYNIPDVTRKNVDWAKIKKACGGSNGYTWGRFRTTANLDNGRQMQVYGGSKQAAEERLRELAELGTAKILTLTTAEELKEGRRATDSWMYKEDTVIYPAFFSVINSKKIIKASNKNLVTQGRRRSKISGDYLEYGSERVPLWVDKEPSNAKMIINGAFTVNDNA